MRRRPLRGTEGAQSFSERSAREKNATKEIDQEPRDQKQAVRSRKMVTRMQWRDVACNVSYFDYLTTMRGELEEKTTTNAIDAVKLRRLISAPPYMPEGKWPVCAPCPICVSQCSEQHCMGDHPGGSCHCIACEVSH